MQHYGQQTNRRATSLLALPFILFHTLHHQMPLLLLLHCRTLKGPEEPRLL